MNEDVKKRFWAKVIKTDECWLWTASKRAKGYGAFVWRSSGKIIQGRAHRFSWELHKGPIPEDKCVLHKCDVPACVRPDHLFLGTKAENNADMVAKGRHVKGGTYSSGNYRRGVKHHAAKLDEETVKKLRHDREDGMSFPKLAKKYGIAISNAFLIVKGKIWKEV